MCYEFVWKKCCGGVVFVYLLKSMVAHVLNLSRILKILHQFMHKMSNGCSSPMEDVHGIYIYLHFNPKKSQSKYYKSQVHNSFLGN